MSQNLDSQTVRGFGRQWQRLTQAELDPAELAELFSQYFSIFPWESLPTNAIGVDLGCGSGRWAKLVAPRVGRLHLVDASHEALDVARSNLASQSNCEFHLASIEALPFQDSTLDFGYALGVLHHIPDTAAGIKACVAKLKPGAPFLLYLYYDFENRPLWYQTLWKLSDWIRRRISNLPDYPRYLICQTMAALVYFPLARMALLCEKLGVDVDHFPLSAYRSRSFYSMRTDSLDRFGTRLELRFSSTKIRDIMTKAGLERITFSQSMPFWCAIGHKKTAPTPMQTHPCSAKPRLMFVVTEDWYFCSHRLPLAKAAIDAGFDVSVATRVQRHGEAIKGSGVRLIPTCLRRSGRNPITESRAIAELRSLYAAERPDIVHHVAAKPVLYGSLAAKLAGVPNVVNAMAGLGFIFSSQGLRASLMRRFLSSAYSWALRGPTVTPVFQNQDDISLFEGLGILPPGKARLIKSSGVDLQRFRAKPEPSLGPGQSPVIILPSRLLWDKGVGEFVEASRIIKERGIRARFILIGDPDAENPACVPVPILSAWRDEALVEWQRWREDMPTAFADCHIVCLPSYREGLPKVLLEAAACTRPIVTTDVPGCREIVRHEENGLLVPSRDPQALADALQTLICSPQARQRFGSRGREIAAEFSLERVIDQTLGLYQEILARDRQTA